MLEIREVKTARDLRRFIAFPHRLYAGNEYWVPPLHLDERNTLRHDKNPAFAFCEARYWLAYKDGKPAGRIAGIINRRYLERWGQKNARFGWLDFIDDEEVSGALLGVVEAWAREKGLTGLHGPLGFCDLDREALLIEGFNELSTMVTIYNHPYYPRHLERHGYLKDADWLEYELKVPDKIPEDVERVCEIVKKRLKLTVLPAKKPKDLWPYAREVFALVNEVYKNLYAVVPLSEEQITAYIRQYFGFINPQYAKIILDENGRMAAFGIALPSLSRALRRARGRLFPLGFLHLLRALKKPRHLDLLLIAVRPDLQNKGVNALLMAEITRAAIENGIVLAESNPELEVNAKVQALWKHYPSRQHKRRRVYLKELA